MVNAPRDDWAWPALIEALQRDILRLHETVEHIRRETADARDRHRNELDALIEQLRDVRAELEPILTERESAQKAKREMLWGWIGKGGWALLAAIGFALWHFITKHFEVKP